MSQFAMDIHVSCAWSGVGWAPTTVATGEAVPTTRLMNTTADNRRVFERM
jgi:hypothetical protein